MPHELLYTSAPRGLDQGSCGFCTVQRTAGLDRVVQRQLEAISGAGVMPDKGSTATSGVVLHTTVIGPSGACRVLSKISVAGEDYTGRTNLLAQHVVLTPAECPPCGPAAMAETPQLFASAWDGRVMQIAPRTLPLVATGIAGELSQWRRVCGDVNIAAVVLLELSRTTSIPVWVIVPDGTPTLRLTAELIGCLEPDERWSVTFTTEYQSLPAGTQCVLRFVSRSSPLADSLIRRGGTGIVNLCQRGGAIPADAAAIAAAIRAGRTVRLHAAQTRDRQAVGASRGGDDSDVLLQLAMQESRQRASDDRGRASGAWSTPGLRGGSGPIRVTGSPGDSLDVPGRTPRSGFRVTGLIALSLATLAICATGAGILLHVRETRHQEALASKRKEDDRIRAKNIADELATLTKELETASGVLTQLIGRTRTLQAAPLTVLERSTPKMAEQSSAATHASELAKRVRGVADHAGQLETELTDAMKLYSDVSGKIQTLQAAASEIDDVTGGIKNDKGLAHASGFDAKVAEQLSNSVAREILPQIARARSQLVELANVIDRYAEATVVSDRVKAKELAALFDDTTMQKWLGTLKAGTLSPDSTDAEAVDWLVDRKSDLQQFAANKNQVGKPVPDAVTPNTWWIEVPFLKTAAREWSANLHGPKLPKQPQLADWACLREQVQDVRWFAKLTAPEGDSAAASLPIGFVRVTGDLLNHDIQLPPPEKLSLAVLCDCLEVEMSLTLPGLAKPIRVRGHQTAPTSDPSASGTLQLIPDESPPASVAPIETAVTGEARAEILRLHTDYSQAFWSNATLTSAVLQLSPKLTSGGDTKSTTPGGLLATKLETQLDDGIDNLEYAIAQFIEIAPRGDPKKNQLKEFRKGCSEVLKEYRQWLKTPPRTDGKTDKVSTLWPSRNDKTDSVSALIVSTLIVQGLVNDAATEKVNAISGGATSVAQNSAVATLLASIATNAEQITNRLDTIQNTLQLLLAFRADQLSSGQSNTDSILQQWLAIESLAARSIAAQSGRSTTGAGPVTMTIHRIHMVYEGTPGEKILDLLPPISIQLAVGAESAAEDPADSGTPVGAAAP